VKIVEVYHISKSFNESFRLDDISFSLEEGEHIFFVGPNGAGKTTLLKLIAGKLLPDEGSIRISGFPIDTHEAEVRNLVGWIPTRDNGFFSRLTGLENIQFFQKFLKIDNLEPRISKWSEIPTFKNMLNVRYADCSSGMRQLLQIFCLTMHVPKVIIMDEPFRSLDPETREHLQKILLEEFPKSSFVMTTHHLDDTSFLAGRVIRIEGGKFAH
jgi:ABC-type multidrug transport system ATPase subunit